MHNMTSPYIHIRDHSYIHTYIHTRITCISRIERREATTISAKHTYTHIHARTFLHTHIHTYTHTDIEATTISPVRGICSHTLMIFVVMATIRTAVMDAAPMVSRPNCVLCAFDMICMYVCMCVFVSMRVWIRLEYSYMGS